MNFRIGINVVDVMVKNGDLFGNCVSIAARLEDLAEMGGICVTRSVGVPWSQLRLVPQSATKKNLASDDNLTEVAFCKSIRDDDDGTELRLALKH
jgi:class 3 adenylate cyclase